MESYYRINIPTPPSEFVKVKTKSTLGTSIIEIDAF